MNVRDLYAALLAGGEKTRPLSLRTVKYTHVTLNKALNEAVDMDLIPSNPASKTKPPTDKDFTPHKWCILDSQKLAGFLDNCQNHEDYFLIFTAAYTGARQSELLGLQWEDINWSKNQINIHRSLHRDSDSDTGYEERERTKNKSSNRVIPVSQKLITTLKQHQEAQGAKMKELGIETSLVFTDERLQPINAGNLSHRFANLSKRLGHEGMRFHDIRHTHATILLSNGAPVADVSRRLGHICSCPARTRTEIS